MNWLPPVPEERIKSEEKKFPAAEDNEIIICGQSQLFGILVLIEIPKSV